MRAVIVVPFRGDDGWRDRNFDVVLPQVESVGLPYVVGDSGDLVFSIARTWNRLAEQAEPWDHLIRWAADFLLDDVAALERAMSDPSHYTYAFNRVVALNARETSAVHRGRPWPRRNDRIPFGGINVITRELWDRVGGFDERFIGWGHEDREWHHRIAEAGYQKGRTPGRMANLWHPKGVEGDPYWERRDANWNLWHEMKEAELEG